MAPKWCQNSTIYSAKIEKTMAQTRPLASILDQMVDLLSSYGNRTWAKSLHRYASRARVEDIRREILRLYSGTGSLNDLVLHSEDLERMKKDNTKFDELRNELFELCRL